MVRLAPRRSQEVQYATRNRRFHVDGGSGAATFHASDNECFRRCLDRYFGRLRPAAVALVSAADLSRLRLLLGARLLGLRALRLFLGTRCLDHTAGRGRRLDPRLVGLAQWPVVLAPGVLGPPHRLLRRHRLRPRLQRSWLPRRVLAPWSFPLQPRGHASQAEPAARQQLLQPARSTPREPTQTHELQRWQTRREPFADGSSKAPGKITPYRRHAHAGTPSCGGQKDPAAAPDPQSRPSGTLEEAAAHPACQTARNPAVSDYR